MDIKNKIVVVTGGAGLLGKNFIQAIVEAGAIAVIGDLDKPSVRAEAQKLSAANDNILFHHVDITDKTSIAALIENISKKFGRIDCLVNNAYPRNKNYGRDFFDVEFADFSENISLHLGGYFLMIQQFGAFFKEQGFGNIINLSSIYGVTAPRFDIYEGAGFTMPVEYAAIKSAVIHLTKYAASYFKGSGIRVNTISPGGIRNGQPDGFIDRYSAHCSSKGMLDPRDIAGTLVFLISDSSRYINGQNLIVDDGFTL